MATLKPQFQVIEEAEREDHAAGSGVFDAAVPPPLDEPLSDELPHDGLAHDGPAHDEKPPRDEKTATTAIPSAHAAPVSRSRAALTREPAPNPVPVEEEDAQIEDYLDSYSIGVALRQARLKRKLALDDVARILRIRKGYIRAIEDGSNQDLPGTTYAVGFVRAYATLVGFDGAEAVQRYKTESENLQPSADLVFPTPVNESRLPAGLMVIGVLVLAAALYGAWYFFSPRFIGAPQVTTATATATATAPATGPATGKASPVKTTAPVAKAEKSKATEKAVVAATAAVKTNDATRAIAGGDSANTGAATAPRSTPTAEAGAKSTMAVATKTPPVANTPPIRKPSVIATMRGVVVSVTMDSWLQVREANGAILLTRLMRPGQIYKVPTDKTGLTLLTGNAGAVRIFVNGKAMPSLGPANKVRRNIPLDAGKLLRWSRTAH